MHRSVLPPFFKNRGSRENFCTVLHSSSVNDVRVSAEVKQSRAPVEAPLCTRLLLKIDHESYSILLFDGPFYTQGYLFILPSL